jgi:hypothetical protein
MAHELVIGVLGWLLAGTLLDADILRASMGGNSLGALAVGGKNVIGHNGGLDLRDVRLAVRVVLEGV